MPRRLAAALVDNLIVILAVGGTVLSILGATLATYALTAPHAGPVAAAGLAATVLGGLTTAAAIVGSRAGLDEGETE